MTSPIVVQQPGVGQQIQQTLAPFLQQLQFQQRQALLASQLQLQQEQFQAQQEQRQITNQRQAIGTVVGLMEAIGPEILDDPAVAGMLEQTGIDPKTPQNIFKKRTQQREQSFKQLKTTVQSRFKDPLLKERAGNLVEGLLSGAIREEATFRQLLDDLVEEQVAEISPEAVEELRAKHPVLFRVQPLDDAVKSAIKIEVGAEEKRFEILEGVRAAPAPRESLPMKQFRAVVGSILRQSVNEQTGEIEDARVNEALNRVGKDAAFAKIPARERRRLFQEERNRLQDRLRQPTLAELITQQIISQGAFLPGGQQQLPSVDEARAIEAELSDEQRALLPGLVQQFQQQGASLEQARIMAILEAQRR